MSVSIYLVELNALDKLSGIRVKVLYYLGFNCAGFRLSGLEREVCNSPVFAVVNIVLRLEPEAVCGDSALTYSEHSCDRAAVVSAALGCCNNKVGAYALNGVNRLIVPSKLSRVGLIGLVDRKGVMLAVMRRLEYIVLGVVGSFRAFYLNTVDRDLGSFYLLAGVG